MFLLFKVMNGVLSDTDAEAIDTLMGKMPTLKFALVFFMITSSWTLLSILTAVVSENMISTTRDQEEELRLAFAEEERQSRMQTLRELFHEMDLSCDGTVDT